MSGSEIRAAARTPLAAERLALGVLATPAPLESDGNGRPAAARHPVRVLLVEDNDAYADLVSAMLHEAWGGEVAFELERAKRLEDARRRLLESAADCVLLDLTLGDARGLEGVHQLQKIAPDVPIVVLSGMMDEGVAVRAVNAGAQDYLVKDQADGQVIGRAIRYALERKRAELELAHQAVHDALTGLPNRTLFLDRLTLSLARAERRPRSVAVLFLDLDRFKVINDSLGHEAGDAVLVELAQRLGTALRPEDTVARFGGDEFTILCEDISHERDTVRIADRVAAAIAEPVALQGRQLHLSVSVGIAIARTRVEQPEAMIRNADAAMYRAKEKGGACHEIFDGRMQERALRRLDMENDLHHALEREELRLHYQPQVSLATGEVVGVEALLRWQHPKRGLLAPDDFIALAEETGLIVPIGDWVLHEACRQTERWHAERGDRSPITVCVNLSARELSQPTLLDQVAGTLSETGVDPARLWIEITESGVMLDADAAIDTLRGLKALGIKLAIDDFGTGYSSLSDLNRFPVDILKIDRSFVGALNHKPQNARIVAAVIGLARSLGLAAIAEGVELAEQLSELQALGCELAQGYYFATPQPPEAVRELIGRHISGVAL